MFWSLGALVQKKKGFYVVFFFFFNIFHTLFEKKEKKKGIFNERICIALCQAEKSFKA